MRAGLFSLYEWKIALRYMIPSKKQTFTSVISCISLLGIIVGVCQRFARLYGHSPPEYGQAILTESHS